MRIALIEPFYHQEIIYRWLELLADPPIHWTVLTAEAIRQQAPAAIRTQENVRWVTWTDPQSAWQTVQEEDATIQDQEAVILLTTGLDYHIWASLAVRPPLILVNHNTTALLRHPGTGGEGVGGSLPALARKLRYDLVGRDRQRLRLLHRTAAIAFPTAYTKMYAERLGPMPTGIILPFGYYRPLTHQAAEDGRVHIGLPMSALSRENYKLVRELLRNLSEQVRQPTTVHLLGRDRQPKRTDQLQKLLKEGALQLNSHTDILDQATYDTLLEQMDFLLLPIPKYQYFGPFRERMGFTKISGSLFDMIYYNCPALLPQHYPLPKATESLVYRYRNEGDLQNTLLQWIADRSYQERRESAQTAMETLNRHAVQQQLRTNLIQIIDA